jgi:hypothetical protein
MLDQVQPILPYFEAQVHKLYTNLKLQTYELLSLLSATLGILGYTRLSQMGLQSKRGEKD